MDKKHIKIIKYLHTQLQKKDKLKNEFYKTSKSILLYSFGTSFIISYLLIYFILVMLGSVLTITDIFNIAFSAFGFSFVFMFLFIFDKFNLFNNLVDKKLQKHNLFNSYGRSYDFNNFLYEILIEIIQSNTKEELSYYTNEIFNIINSITNQSLKNDIKMRFIKKMEITIEIYTEEKNNIIKHSCKYVGVNN